MRTGLLANAATIAQKNRAHRQCSKNITHFTLIHKLKTFGSTGAATHSAMPILLQNTKQMSGNNVTGFHQNLKNLQQSRQFRIHFCASWERYCWVQSRIRRRLQTSQCLQLATQRLYANPEGQTAQRDPLDPNKPQTISV